MAPALVAVLAVSAGCGDVSRLPTDATRAERPIHRGTARVLGLGLVAPLERANPLAAEVSWTFTVGPAGGTSSNAAVGLTIVVPAGALSTTETITVTALAGAPVAYRFAPHLAFDRRVRLVQGLSLIRPRSWIGLVGAHFAGDFLQITSGLATVTESVPAFISILDGTIRLDVRDRHLIA